MRTTALFIIAVLLSGCSTYYVIPKGMTTEEAAAAVKAKEAAKAAAPTVVFVSIPQVPVYYGPGCYPYYCGIPTPSFGGGSINFQYHRHDYRR